MERDHVQGRFVAFIRSQTPIFALVLLVALPAAQAVASPFANLGGSWSGAGVITNSSGATEKIRCRATYTVDRNGDNLSIALRCATTST